MISDSFVHARRHYHEEILSMGSHYCRFRDHDCGADICRRRQQALASRDTRAGRIGRSLR